MSSGGCRGRRPLSPIKACAQSWSSSHALHQTARDRTSETVHVCARRPALAPPGDEDAQALEMAFSKKRVEDRKKWLSGYVPGTFLDQSVDTISYSDFVHKASQEP